MERVIVCPHCYNTDQCFEEMQETFSSFLCFSCGFMSDSRYKIGSVELTENLKNTPKLVQNSQFEDKERGIVWFPSVINMGELGMIYPESHLKSYKWKYAKVVDIPEEEQPKYDNHTKRLDVENALTFDKNQFIKACEAMGITRNLNNNE